MLFFNTRFYAQDPLVDSLKIELKNAKHDTTRILILSELSDVCEMEDILLYATPCATLCEKGLESTTINPHLKELYKSNLAIAYYNIAWFAGKHDEASKAINYFFKSLKQREELNDKKGEASVLNNIGFFYDNLGDIPKALDCYFKCMKIQEQINNQSGIADACINIGTVYDNYGELDKAIEYYNKGLKISKKIKLMDVIAISLNNIGFVYSKKGDDNKALSYYKESLAIRQEMKDDNGIATALGNIGGIYDEQHDFVKAIYYCEESLKLQEKIDDKIGITMSLRNLGRTLLKVGKVNEAYNYSIKSLKMAQELGYPKSVMNAANILKDIYMQQHKFKDALEMYELEILMRDSINNENSKNASIKKQFQYEYEKQATADSVKHAEEQKVKNAQLTALAASLKQEQTQRYALYGGLLLVIGFSVFVFNRFKLTQKQKKIIEDQKVLVDSAYESLHEKNKEVMDSIYYARRIQRALLTSELYIDRVLGKLNKKI